VKRNAKRTSRWNDTVKTIVEDKNKAWTRFLGAKTREAQAKCIEKRNYAKRVMREAKADSWVQFGNEAEERFGEDERKFWSIIKSLRGKYGKRIRIIKNQENKLETETTKVLEVWRLHYEEKFRPEEGEARVLETESLEEGNNETLGDINEMEVKEALKKMKNGKAAGWDEIAPEMLKAGREALEKQLIKPFTKVWHEERIPKDWEKNIIIPLYKKGDSSKCENYRAVCLSSVALKALSRIIEARLRMAIEGELEEKQAAFRPGTQT
jgi:hypothetical protein